MNQTDAITIEVREPTDAEVGCISARSGQLGPELCYAVGRECGAWYLSVSPAAAEAAGIGHRRIHMEGGREDADHLVRLIAALSERRTMDEGMTRDDPALVEALISSYSILSLLHHRGLVDSQFNRDDVAAALNKLEPFAKAAERIARST
jgi:hypothetical protein